MFRQVSTCSVRELRESRAVLSVSECRGPMLEFPWGGGRWWSWAVGGVQGLGSIRIHSKFPLLLVLCFLFLLWIENGHYCEIRKKDGQQSGFLLIWYRLKIFLIYVEKFIYKFSFRSKSHDIKTKCCVTRFTPWNLNRAIYLRWLIPACDTCHVSPPTIKINNTLHNKPRS